MSYQDKFNALLETRPLLAAAFQYASAAHRRVGQKRRYSGEEYEIHPMQAVVYASETIHNDETNLAIIMMHDVLEDTLLENQTVEQAALSMGLAFTIKFDNHKALEIVNGVMEMTDVAVPSDGNRKARMAINADHAAQASPPRQTGKLVDMKSNMPSIIKHDPGFARKWVAEKKAVAVRMTQADPTLRAEVLAMIDAYERGKFRPDDYEIV
jgi:(p)ppGpp synthase/HD superfamily hydrolase